MPRFYFDISRMRKSMKDGQTPYTPALPQLFGLRVALQRILGEGLEASYRRHARLAAATRAAARAIGLELFAGEGSYSNSLTAIRAPDGTGPFITWGPPVPPRSAKRRLHLEIAPIDVDERTEVDRLLSIGATRVDARAADARAADADSVVLADPDGNELWVLRSR